MQTFLPYTDFVESAKCLDYRRLGKQRVEAKQIYDIITGNTKSKAWQNHLAVKMWKNYPEALALYYNTIILEWSSRGYKNGMDVITFDLANLTRPIWLTDEFCSYHRATLLFKDYNYYSKFGWAEEPMKKMRW